MSDANAGRGDSGELVYWWSPRGDDRVFDLSSWPEEARDVVRSVLETSEVPHRWEDDTLVVDAADREDAQAVLDDVVAASRPRLESDEDRVAYDMADWPDYEIDALASALERDGILHEWTEDGELLVYEADERRVDALFEELDLLGPQEDKVRLDGEALTSLLTSAYVAVDRLSKHATDADAVVDAATAAEEIVDVAVPLGFDEGAWTRLVAQLAELRDVLVEQDEQVEDEEVSARARDIRDRLRTWL
jgi:hypothetical protein